VISKVFIRNESFYSVSSILISYLMMGDAQLSEAVVGVEKY